MRKYFLTKFYLIKGVYFVDGAVRDETVVLVTGQVKIRGMDCPVSGVEVCLMRKGLGMPDFTGEIC